MYELIVFTMMLPHAKPEWLRLKPTTEIVCLQKKKAIDKLFSTVEGLTFTLVCEPVKKDAPL